MRANPLKKHYPGLTPRELYAALMAAITRGDDADAAALAAAPPPVAVVLPEVIGVAVAFDAAASWSAAKRLGLSTLYFASLHLAADAEADEAPRADEARAGRMRRAARLTGYLLAAHREGWRAFCDGLGLADPRGDCEIDAMLLRAEELAADDAFTEAEAIAYGRERDPDLDHVLTAADVAADLREAYETRLAVFGIAP